MTTISTSGESNMLEEVIHEINELFYDDFGPIPLSEHERILLGSILANYLLAGSVDFEVRQEAFNFLSENNAHS